MKQTKILHLYIGSLSAGLLFFQKDLNNELVKNPNLDIYILYGIDDRTPANYKSFFNPKIHLICIDDFTDIVGFNVKKILHHVETVKKYVSEIQPDVIHMHTYKSGLVGNIACRSYKKKFYTPHGFIGVASRMPKWRRELLVLVERLFHWYGNTTIIASSKGEWELCKRLTSNPLRVDNGVELEELKPYASNSLFDDNGRIKVYNVARAEVQKNPHAFNDIALLAPDEDFTWIGSGSLDAEIVASNIRKFGFLPKEDTLGIIKGCSILLMTSLWEGQAMAQLEAMAMKKLNIVSNAPGLRDVIKNGENGIVYNDISEVPSILKDIYERPLYYQELVDKAYGDCCNLYSSSVMAQKYLQIYLK